MTGCPANICASPPVPLHRGPRRLYAQELQSPAATLACARSRERRSPWNASRARLLARRVVPFRRRRLRRRLVRGRRLLLGLGRRLFVRGAAEDLLHRLSRNVEQPRGAAPAALGERERL